MALYGNNPSKQPAKNNASTSVTRRRTLNHAPNHGYDTATGFY